MTCVELCLSLHIAKKRYATKFAPPLVTRRLSFHMALAWIVWYVGTGVFCQGSYSLAITIRWRGINSNNSFGPCARFSAC